jgi:hypothetical protein
MQSMNLPLHHGELADQGDIRGGTKAINGLDDPVGYLNRAKAVLRNSVISDVVIDKV